MVPLSNNSVFDDFSEELEKVFVAEGIECKVDTSSVAIGRKYAGADELDIPFGVKNDFDRLEDRQVTMRERDSTAQVRIPIDAIGSEVRKLVKGLATLNETLERYPKVKVTADSPEGVQNTTAATHPSKSMEYTKAPLPTFQLLITLQE
ncbi:hypothetical protein PsorP6_000285 [Peronosclerospora sorghi]|uniref:Uncharacterized protein n=1 Tax=Peronosclerospora sorghi TaxID=230839 RepID=A0ACC0WS94_9STRA|nr:hypothetical protein PsorP6_000285 [Peronosclerospora sorghi]